MKPGSREVLLMVIAKTSDDKFARFPGPVLWFAELAISSINIRVYSRHQARGLDPSAFRDRYEEALMAHLSGWSSSRGQRSAPTQPAAA
jgi:hypothetical protein